MSKSTIQRTSNRRLLSSSIFGQLVFTATILFVFFTSNVTVRFVQGRKLAGARRVRSKNPTSRGILIKNDAGGPRIDVKWIHPTTRERAESNFEDGIVFGAEGALSSYIGHSFEVLEIPNPKTQKCKRGMCRKAYFTVNENEDQLFIVKDDFSVIVEDSKTRAKEKATKALGKCKALDQDELDQLSPMEQIERMTECLEKQVDAALSEQQEEIDFQKNVRKDIGTRLVTYACRDDEKMKTSVPLRNDTWTYGGRQYDVQCIFETEISSLWIIKNAFSDVQCRDMKKYAFEHGPAIVTDKNRRLLPLAARTESPIIDSAISKLEQLIKAFLEVGVKYQVDPMLEIREQTLDSFPTLTVQDPSCPSDGVGNSPTYACPAHYIKLPQIVKAEENLLASVRVFCEVPKKGGSLHFHKTGDHVKTSELQGAALLIVYKDPLKENREEDPYVEEYYECPVEEGSLVSVIDHFG